MLVAVAVPTSLQVFPALVVLVAEGTVPSTTRRQTARQDLLIQAAAVVVRRKFKVPSGNLVLRAAQEL